MALRLRAGTQAGPDSELLTKKLIPPARTRKTHLMAFRPKDSRRWPETTEAVYGALRGSYRLLPLALCLMVSMTSMAAMTGNSIDLSHRPSTQTQGDSQSAIDLLI